MTDEWRPWDPCRPPWPGHNVTYYTRWPEGWRPFEADKHTVYWARREAAALEHHAEQQRKRAAGLPCGMRVRRHVSARWRDYGPCTRLAGHPGPCDERLS